MSYPFAPEFQSAGNGYSPDKFYTMSRFGPQGDRAWVSMGKHSLPAEMMARVNDLIHTRRYPAYHSFADFLRDACVHHLYRRLSELDDPYWNNQRDIFAATMEMERREVENTMVPELIDRWHRLLDGEQDRKRRAELVEECREDLEAIRSEYWRDKLEEIVKRWER